MSFKSRFKVCLTLEILYVNFSFSFDENFYL